MVKVLAFMGSPRKKGNVDTILDEIIKGVNDNNVEVKKYYLNDMNIKGCQGCLYCRKVPTCAFKDDMIDIYKDIKSAEYIIIGSPVYICQVSAQTKLLLDRLYPLTEINKSKHTPRFGQKKLIMVYTQAAPVSFLFKKYFKYTSKHLKGMGLNHYKTIVATKAFERNSTKKNFKVLRKAYKLGMKIAIDING
ncbi:flavodoxin family protein [Clostridioides difficile]|uniref:Flavodoxin family protein n=2 Tax=Clostridioides difficile TaxID=1496 RepID=A0A9P4DBS2_CLODI|nr:flavodoxin family protein [Clostridioides difficile]AWH77880.1 flavodoxin family protein [Clostridioides difficile]AWH81621.1 flavodoxin family protein [Clostridioides difficile]AXU46773.1 NADPH-dependent FMN reductase [Clostridioides difficile]AXU50433.1 NADPH-dependent FMN reductase [Clostridioides difficile]AXU64904.1 NADPH-dependent FMN reductase [Clostridioides difficile]